MVEWKVQPQIKANWELAESGSCYSICFKDSATETKVWVQLWLQYCPAALPPMEHHPPQWHVLCLIHHRRLFLNPQTCRRLQKHDCIITTAQEVWLVVLICVGTDDLPYLKCPLHTVLKLTPVAYGKSELCFCLLWMSSFVVVFSPSFMTCVFSSSTRM